MKKTYAIIAVILLSAIICTGQTKKIYPTIVLNDKYNQIQKEGSKVMPQNYELRSLQGLILDCSDYDFSLIKTMSNNKLPDQVQLLSRAGTYTVKLNSKGQTIIDKSTMQLPGKKDKKFAGFIKGDTIMLAIGTIKNNEMMTYWLGMINVR